MAIKCTTIFKYVEKTPTSQAGPDPVRVVSGAS
jgi:hypothetical protein